MTIFGCVPFAIVPTAIAVITFLVYDQFTAAGRKGKVLKNNQSAGGMQQIIMGVFVFGFYTFSAQLGNITKGPLNQSPAAEQRIFCPATAV